MPARLLFILCLLVASAVFHTNAQTQTANRGAGNYKYSIERTSELKLKGTTNINAFSCKCKEQFPVQQFTIQSKAAKGKLEFNATYLYVPIAALDCGNKKMNTDMQRALNANSFPKIKIELLKAEEEPHCPAYVHCNDNDNNGWTPVKIQAKISMNGHTRECEIHVNSKKEGNSKLYFKGAKRLKMSDFNVTPPEVFFGTVKVNDSVEIVFDLLVNIN
ncbi:YceI family protein [Sphingobacteriales bacterium UPWRP_1]|nr:hypothetical protein BVG80_18525 [Sphingobacteriales bacterium TSM_CSM]PSJ73336.1 YceI family protein [Sphingobacteriales bacterium UPWRP_1]